MLYPVGYMSTTPFQCAINSRQTCRYVCEIRASPNGAKPVFSVMPPCAPQHGAEANSPYMAWRKVWSAVRSTCPLGRAIVDASARFGLSLPHTRRALQLLPGIEHVTKYTCLPPEEIAQTVVQSQPTKVIHLIDDDDDDDDDDDAVQLKLSLHHTNSTATLSTPRPQRSSANTTPLRFTTK